MKAKITKSLLPIILLGNSLFTEQSIAENSRQHSSYEAYSVDELKQQLQRQKQNGQFQLLKALPDDFATIADNFEKKRLFISVMLPIVLAENQRLAEQRALAKLMIPAVGERRLGDQPADQWLKQILKRYRVKHRGVISPDIGKSLLHRLDVVPSRLVLAQAAIESGWGTSRFALQGNSLFGQWTWEEGKGIAPSERVEGATHSVKAFDSLRASVREYLLNLNTNQAYVHLRDLRQQLRDQRRELDSHILAAGLSRYSQRGDHYVDEVRAIINSADLEQLTFRVVRQ